MAVFAADSVRDDVASATTWETFQTTLGDNGDFKSRVLTVDKIRDHNNSGFV